MKTLTVKDISREGASRAVRAAESEPVLISKNNEPAVWMISADAMAQAALAAGGTTDLYRAALHVLAVKLFDAQVLSLGRAAELAGLDMTAFMELCGALQIPVYRTPQQGLGAEVTAFDTWLRSAQGATAELVLGD